MITILMIIAVIALICVIVILSIINDSCVYFAMGLYFAVLAILGLICK